MPNVLIMDEKREDLLRREGRRLSERWRSRIGSSIRSAREGRDMTQGALAALVGVDIATISKTERGKTVPDLATLESIADILSASLDDLVGRRAPTPQETEDAGGRLSRNPWPVIAMLQSQLDEMRSEMRQDRDRRSESAPKRPPKAPRSA